MYYKTYEQLQAKKAEIEEALQEAIDRLKDILERDDGQAWIEAEKALPRIKDKFERNKFERSKND